MDGWIDYWCNAFTPDRRAVWEESIASQGIPLRIRGEGDDGFTDPESMVARMDELGVASLLLPIAEAAPDAGPMDFERVATTPEQADALATKFPGRFASLISIDPGTGMEGVRHAARLAEANGTAGLLIHTHSFDRPFDHRDYYPYYALASDLDLPVVVQAGSSGGRMASECGRPIGVDRPALYFGDLRFVLSHTGWPWETEAFAMALKHPNVYLGTAAYPAHHWSEALRRFLAGAGRGKVMMGTSFPVVGHRQALKRLEELGLDESARRALIQDAAQGVFTRLVAQK